MLAPLPWPARPAGSGSQPAGVFGGVKGRMMRHVAGRVSDSLQIESASGTGCEGV